MEPLENIVFVELLEDCADKKQFDTGKKIGKLVKIISKGSSCRDCYRVGDICLIIEGQQLECPELGVNFLHDEDILAIKE